MKSIVITGVSSGIGYDAVRHFVSLGYQVFGSVRKQADQQRLESEFPERFKCFLFDVVDRAAIQTAADEITSILDGNLLTCLFNNAGVALAGPLQLINSEAFDRQLLVNISGARNVINAFLPLLGASLDRSPNQKPGKIINNSPINGFINTPVNGSYCIAKHAIESLGEVYRRELMMYGIDVVAIQSGPIQSQIWNKSTGALDEFKDSDYGPMIIKSEAIMEEARQIAQPAEVFSRLVQKIIETPNPKTAYIIHKQRWRLHVMRWLPKRWLDRMMYKKLS